MSGWTFACVRKTARSAILRWNLSPKLAQGQGWRRRAMRRRVWFVEVHLKVNKVLTLNLHVNVLLVITFSEIFRLIPLAFFLLFVKLHRYQGDQT